MSTTSATFIDLRINNAEQFKESLSESSANTVLYATMGKTESWANTLSPNVANSSTATYYEIWDNMIGGKRLVGSDLSHAIPRCDWAANTVYTAYDSLNANLFDDNVCFYIMTSAYGVYKCLSNNYSANSTVEPTAINPDSTTTTSDGYTWKYMYTVSDAERLRFLTSNFIPVKRLTVDDGSVQWTVQANAVSGSVESVVMTSGGAGYANSSNIVVSMSGDGTGWDGYATINAVSNTVNSVVVTDAGSGYSFGTVTITGGGGTGAAARAVISPPGGHGSDPLYELGAKNIVVNARFKYSEDGVLPETNDFGQIAILKDPCLYSTTTAATQSAFLQTYSITAIGIGDYIEDEFVYQGSSLAGATFKGRVMSWDPSTSQLLLINTFGNPTSSVSLIGDDSTTVRTISSVSEGDFKKYTGRILYVDNVKSITRASDQIEDFKVVIRF